MTYQIADILNEVSKSHKITIKEVKLNNTYRSPSSSQFTTADVRDGDFNRTSGLLSATKINKVILNKISTKNFVPRKH